MTVQDLVIATLWLAGLTGGIIGAAGLIYYGIAFLRLARDRRSRARNDERVRSTASHGA